MQSQQPHDTLGKRTTIRRHHQRRCRAPFFHHRKRARVIHGVAANQNSFVVAAVLAFGPNLPAHPPNRRVIEEQRFRGNLEKIHKAIQPADVCQLMRDHRFDLLFGQAAQRPHRQQHDRTKPSQYGRSIQALAFAIAHRALDAHSQLQCDTSQIKLPP